MPIPLNRIAIVFTVVAAALGGAVVAQDTVAARPAILQAVAEGTLNELVVVLAKSNSCEFVARAMLEADVSYDDAIAALLAAELPGDTVSRCLQAVVSSTELAALDAALLRAGIDPDPTGAGPVDSGPTIGPVPFVGSPIGVGGGGSSASSS